MPVRVVESTKVQRHTRVVWQDRRSGTSGRQLVKTAQTIACMESASDVGYHEPALVASVLRFLAPRPGAVIVDATCGTGGHSLSILPRLLPTGRLIAVDRDAEALGVAKRRLAEFDPQVTFHHGNFRDLPEILQALNIPRVDGLLLDLGMSSLQVDQPERGFSFLKEGPLDMRMDVQQDTTAATLVNRCSAEELANLLTTFGEERFARRIAQRIVAERRKDPITTTTQLAQLITRAVPSRSGRARLHPATRTFQALRIAVNDELGALETLLAALPALLAPKARAVMLSFHSLEDRRVKHAFAKGDEEGLWNRLTKKTIRASTDEVSRNPRARSVKLRAVERP